MNLNNYIDSLLKMGIIVLCTPTALCPSTHLLSRESLNFSQIADLVLVGVRVLQRLNTVKGLLQIFSLRQDAFLTCLLSDKSFTVMSQSDIFTYIFSKKLFGFLEFPFFIT